MKLILITVALIGLSGCTAVGFMSDIIIIDELEKLDEKIDKITNIKTDAEKKDTIKGIEHNNNDKDIKKAEKDRKKEEAKKQRIQFPLTKTGWEMDKLIIKKIFSTEDDPKSTKKDIDNRACTEKNYRQICTAIKGCWCEKTEVKN